jgi:hypothetical protein
VTSFSCQKKKKEKQGGRYRLDLMMSDCLEKKKEKCDATATGFLFPTFRRKTNKYTTTIIIHQRERGKKEKRKFKRHQSR